MNSIEAPPSRFFVTPYRRWLLIFVTFCTLTSALLISAGASAGEVTYQYDDAGRLKSVRYPNTAQKTYTLDAAGNRNSVATTLDEVAPSVPASLTASAPSAVTVNLAWSASTDSVGVTGYRVERCTGAGCSSFAQIGTPTSTSFADTTVSSATSYSYRVRAVDAAANLSGYSNTAAVTTPDNIPPSAPTGLTATSPNATTVNLAWNVSTDNVGVAGYRVERCTGAGCSSFAQIGTPTSTSFSDTTASGATNYSYRVRAVDAANNLGGYSSTATVTTADNVAPSAPTGVTATSPSSTTVNLSWTASTDNIGVTGYRVERCAGAGCASFAQIGTASATSFSDTSLAGTTSYSYRVSATDATGNLSGYSSVATVVTPDTIAPSAPTGLTAASPNSNTVNLSWNASTDTGGSGLAGYRIFRSGTQIGTSGTTAFSDTSVVGTTAYSYTVAAYDGTGNTSTQSSAASVTTPDTIAPSTPNLNSWAVTSTVTLNWSASTDTGGSGLAGYRVFHGCPVGLVIATTTALTYNAPIPSAGATCSYTISAYDNAGNISGESNAATASTPAVPSAPTSISGPSFTTNTSVTLSWSSVALATSYELWNTTFTPTLVYSGTALSKQLTLGPGTVYSFYAKACNSGGCSGPSPTKIVTVDCPVSCL
jgi:fibronectin type 3 domain-containing protein